MSPGLLVSDVVSEYQDTDGSDESTGASDSGVEDLATGTGTGSSNGDFLGSRIVALILEADLLALELEVGTVASGQRDVDA